MAKKEYEKSLCKLYYTTARLIVLINIKYFI